MQKSQGHKKYDENGDKEISKYDENGNMIYCKEFSHYEQWWDYDENGNCVHYKNSEGTESWSEYNASGKLIYNRDLYESGAWYEYRYDEKTTGEFMENWEGFNCVKEYDENGNEILCKEADQ